MESGGGEKQILGYGLFENINILYLMNRLYHHEKNNFICFRRIIDEILRLYLICILIWVFRTTFCSMMNIACELF